MRIMVILSHVRIVPPCLSLVKNGGGQFLPFSPAWTIICLCWGDARSLEKHLSEKELKRKVEGLKRLRRKVCASKESARDFLVKAGICTRAGTLRKAYR